MQLKGLLGIVVAAGLFGGCSTAPEVKESFDSTSAAQKAETCVVCKDPIADLEADLAKMQAELGIADADMARFRPILVSSLTQVRDQIAAMGTTPEGMNEAGEGSAFFNYLLGLRNASNSDYTVVQVGTMKLLYRYHPRMTMPSEPGVRGESFPAYFTLVGIFPETMSESAIISTDQGKRDLFNLQMLEIALKVGPWLLVPVIGQVGAGCALAAAGSLLVIDALTGETIGTITDDASFVVLAGGKLAPGPLKLAAHAWLLTRLSLACVSVGKNAKLYLALLFANARANGLNEDIFVGPGDVGVGDRAKCDVRPSKPKNISECRSDNAAWAKTCCPAGQVGTGQCTLEEQRCKTDPNAPLPPMPRPLPLPKAVQIGVAQ